MDIEEKIINAPNTPGVYLFKDYKGDIIYIGKAKSISKRVKSYFADRYEKPVRTLSLLEKIKDVQCITTKNELEALLLENNLIKQHKPLFNIRLKDDKTYPYLKLTVNEKIPRLVITRKLRKDGALYFGPFTPVGAVKENLKILSKIFQVCTCKKPVKEKNTRPCLNYQIGLCSAPCHGLITKEKYLESVERAKSFLIGRTDKVIKYFKGEMEKRAEFLRFEDAARYRDAISSIQIMAQKQRIDRAGGKDHDAIAWSVSGNRIAFCVLNIRNGRLIGQREYSFENIAYLDETDVCESFLKRYYEKEIFIPPLILIYKKPRDIDIILEWLKKRNSMSIKLFVPKRGHRHELIKMALENAEIALKKYHDRMFSIRERISEMKNILKLKNMPERIEGIDVSNISGEMGVGSIVVWGKGNFNKDEYRKFKIKTTSIPDDCRMISEVFTRRYKRLIAEKKDLPSLVLIDGGKGQLNAAKKALEEIGATGIDIISIAKGKSILKSLRREGLGEYSEEEIFTASEEHPLRFKKTSPVLHILQSIRDEAHRFAIRYHKILRKKNLHKSALDEIPGIGEKKKKELLKHFGSIERIKKSSLEELAKVKLIDKKTAVKIKNYLSAILPQATSY